MAFTVLVKFFMGNADEARALAKRIGFTSEKIRRGIEVERGLEARHREEMVAQGLGEVRPGRADSGTPIFGPEGLQNVLVHHMLEDLIEAGYSLVEIVKIERPKFDWSRDAQGRPNKALPKRPVPGKNQHILQLQFVSHGAEESEVNVDAILKELINWLKEDDGRAVVGCHVWSNSNGVDTVNFVGGFRRSGSHTRVLGYEIDDDWVLR